MKEKLVWRAVILLLTAPLAAQSITVTSPKYGGPETGGVERPAHWCVGETHSILWVKQGTMQATVTIALRFSDPAPGAEPALYIASGETNDGGYSWTIPNTVAPGYYFLRVRTDDMAVIGDGPVFSICSSPSIIVTSPRKTDEWSVGSTHPIQWKKWCSMKGNVTIALRKEGSPAGSEPALYFVTGAANNGYYSDGKIPNDIVPGNYYVRVRTDDKSVVGDSEIFKIGKPFVTLIRPNGPENWKIGTRQGIAWRFAFWEGKVNLFLMRNGKYKGAIARDLPTMPYSYSWKVGVLGNGTIVDPGAGYRVRVVRDYSGPVIPILQLMDESDYDFTIEPKKSLVENLKD